jgi:hypothetical protein
MDVPKRLVRAAITALLEKGATEAGMSQAPELIKLEHTQAFKDAQELKRLLKDDSKPKRELNSGDMLAFCGPPAGRVL